MRLRSVCARCSSPLAAIFAVAGPAAADRPTCEDLLVGPRRWRTPPNRWPPTSGPPPSASKRASGVAEQHKRLDAQRDQFEAAHAERLAR